MSNLVLRERHILCSRILWKMRLPGKMVDPSSLEVFKQTFKGLSVKENVGVDFLHWQGLDSKTVKFLSISMMIYDSMIFHLAKISSECTSAIRFAN